jgi:hypothetical protein
MTGGYVPLRDLVAMAEGSLDATIRDMARELIERREADEPVDDVATLDLNEQVRVLAHDPTRAARFRFVTPTPCTGKNSRRIVKFGHKPALVKSKQALATALQVQQRCLWALRTLPHPLIPDDDVAVHMRHHVARDLFEVVVEPIGAPPTVDNWRARDTGNLPDVVLDAMQDLVFANDNQVARLVVERV